MAMMQTIMVATTAAPPVMMPAAAAMAPSVTAAMSVPSLDLDYGAIRHAKRVRSCNGHRRRRKGWSYGKGAGGKSDQQKPFHVSVSPLNSRYRDKGGKFRRLTEFPF
jgi:hypothetical protein